MRIAIAFILVAFAAAALGQERRIDELMRKSGLDDHMAQVLAHTRAGAEQARAEAKARGNKGDLTDAQYARLLLGMNVAFAPEKLRTVVRAEMLKEVSAADEEEVLRWLSSDLGVRITKLEEERDQAERYQKMEAEMPEFMKTVPKARLALCERLAESIGSGESSARLMINITVAIAYGIALSMPGGDVEAIKEIRAKLESQRPQMEAAMQQHAIGIFAYTYQPLGDAELGRYVDFAESPVGRRYHRATIKAVDRAMLQGSIELGRQFGAQSLEPDRQL
jgi:hypothetical protein